MADTENKIKKRDNTYCCVPQCTTKGSKNPDLSFHKFPRERNNVEKNVNKSITSRRKEWIRILKIGKSVSQRMSVCSKHFCASDFFKTGEDVKRPKLKQTAVPSQNLPVGSCSDKNKEFLKKQIVTERKSRYEKIKSKRTIQTEKCKASTSAIDELEAAEALLELFGSNEVPVSDSSTAALTELPCQKCKEKIVVDQSVGVCSGDLSKSRLIIASELSEQQLKSMTGLHSFDLLNGLEEAVCCSVVLSNKYHLPIKERIILTFMRLKLNISFASLSVFFGTTSTNCIRIFSEYIELLAKILENHIEWFDKHEILSNLPKCFKYFPQVRVVLDCTEVEVQRPKCLICRGRLYSQYKGTYTAKYLIGISPGGVITFVSNGFGGRCSDKTIFNMSNIVQMVEPHVDAIMVDRGFLIDEECEEHFISFIRPPFLKNKKLFSASEARQTRAIAKARVHVERMIQRIKTFKFFSSAVPFSMLRHLDNIVLIAAAVSNLGSPILADERF